MRLLPTLMIAAGVGLAATAATTPAEAKQAVVVPVYNYYGPGYYYRPGPPPRPRYYAPPPRVYYAPPPRPYYYAPRPHYYAPRPSVGFSFRF